MAPEQTKVVRGVTLRRDPSREACFTVAHTDAEMMEWPDMSEIARRERVHRHMNNETGAMEIAAQCLVDFPEAPWELRLLLARQTYDESRHVTILYQRVKEMGGRKGEFPVSNFEWSVTCMLDSLAARLAVQNRTFEAGQMDLLGNLRSVWRSVGDDKTADVLEGILADEINHVRFANQWIKRLCRENRAVLLKVAMAIRYLASVTTALAPREDEVNLTGMKLGGSRQQAPKVNIEDRRHADFTEEEIHEILRQAGFRSVVPPSEA